MSEEFAAREYSLVKTSHKYSNVSYGGDPIALAIVASTFLLCSKYDASKKGVHIIYDVRNVEEGFPIGYIAADSFSEACKFLNRHIDECGRRIQAGHGS